ncbi:hypothetical protein FP2506_18349 [Fulvimarina pelagi HTCC2506]|uniref:Uncharacterized protein n=2 Tax=Fulvimarina pelagi TaxID=217511 RepID=Q0G0W3_9HYPH|nr:hypothetical protein FP2506_18349 [Fulvimarina pelagi HTCC2506]
MVWAEPNAKPHARHPRLFQTRPACRRGEASGKAGTVGEASAKIPRGAPEVSRIQTEFGGLASGASPPFFTRRDDETI